MSAAFGPDGVRVDGAGHLVWEGVETTIDGPDWVAVVLTYGPDRRALETVRRRLAAEANACPAPGRCGLFLHAPDCPRRLSPLAAPGAPIRRDRTAPTITTPAVAIGPDGAPYVTYR